MKETCVLNVRRNGFVLHDSLWGKISFEARARLDGREIRLADWQMLMSPSRFVSQTAEGEWSLEVKREASGVAVTLGVNLRTAVRSVQLEPMVIRRLRADHLAVHGRKMGGCRLLLLDEAGKEAVASHLFVALTRKGLTLCLSHPLGQRDLSSFAVETGTGRLETIAAATVIENNRRKVLKSAPVTVAASSDGHSLLTSWAESQISVSEPEPVPPESGWNSWDYYRWTITEDEVCRNAELIAGDPILSRHIKHVIVDDGWQYCYGEWEPNCFFPSGMRKLARTLRRMGFVPGLWFAPTIAEPHSRAAQLEPDCLAKGASGFPCLAFSCMERKGFILDPTHPKVRAEWSRLFRKYRDYGIDYFKLDFMAWTVPNRVFWDRSAKPGELMHRILTPIRAAVGPSTRILGCNCNFEDLRGLADEVRVSSDIHAQWVSTKANASAIATRFWAHRRFWINDPDFLVCRGAETSDDPDLHRLKPALPFVRPDDPNTSGKDYLHSLVDLSAREAETLASLVIVSGGAMNLSDNLPRLNERGLDILRKSVQAEKGAAAIPLDLFKTDLPSQWVQKLDSGMHRVLLVNWSDRRRMLRADLADWNVPRAHVRDFWTGESISVSSGRIERLLPPHACLLLETRA